MTADKNPAVTAETAAALIAQLEARRDALKTESKKSRKQAEKLGKAIRQVKKALRDELNLSQEFDWAAAFTPTADLPAAATQPDLRRSRRTGRPAPDMGGPHLNSPAPAPCYQAAKPFDMPAGFVDGVGALFAEEAAKPEAVEPAPTKPLFTPSSKTKRTVVFLVDGSGSFGRHHVLSVKSHRDETLVAIQKAAKRSLTLHDTNPAHEIVLFGDTAPVLIDKTATRHDGLNCASNLAPSIQALRAVAAANPAHMLHVVIICDGDLFDMPAAQKELQDFLAATPRLTVDVIIANSDPEQAHALKKAMTALDQKRTSLTESLPIEPGITGMLNALLEYRLGRPLPPVTNATPVKKPPTV